MIIDLFYNYIDSKIAEQILEYYNEDCYYIDICDKNNIYKYSNKKEGNQIIKNTEDKSYIINNCENISHIAISMKNNALVINLYNILKDKFKELEIMIMQDSFNNTKWIEIVAKGSSKYRRINELSKYIGINNEKIIAFGDGLNDIEMLEKCGYGVALINALPEVKEKANDVASFDYNNDDVIKYLMDYLNID